MEEPKPSAIEKGLYDQRFIELYGPAELEDQRRRYAEALRECEKHFGAPALHLFSSPGRTELGGNHTDHNNGRVLAASIQLDKVAAVIPVQHLVVRIDTEQFDERVEVDLRRLEPMETERGTASSLVRGIASYFQRRGYSIGGFSAYITSRVAMGSGLSSSASLEVLIAQIFNSLYNGGHISLVECAKAGQSAENRFFGKPCGLMDQIACAQGGVVSIDFADPQQPLIRSLRFSFAEQGYRLCILDTGSSHADLSDDYRSVPAEMDCAAAALGAGKLRQTDTRRLFARIRELRRSCGDRAVLRAIHFFGENERVTAMVRALEEENFASYLDLVRASGSSSWRLLQNCIPSSALQTPGQGADARPGRRQGLALALGLTEELLGGSGAVRVHGGGFAGTIQLYVPQEDFAPFRRKIETVFKVGSLTELRLRREGVRRL